jgi:hypothetical protein
MYLLQSVEAKGKKDTLEHFRSSLWAGDSDGRSVSLQGSSEPCVLEQPLDGFRKPQAHLEACSHYQTLPTNGMCSEDISWWFK